MKHNFVALGQDAFKLNSDSPGLYVAVGFNPNAKALPSPAFLNLMQDPQVPSGVRSTLQGVLTKGFAGVIER